MAKNAAVTRKPKMNLITTIDFLERKNAQTIYSSQLYGTFFSIHALMDTNAKPKANHYLINSMKLFVVNYKGILNLGIKRAEFKAVRNNKWAWNLKIEVEVKRFEELEEQDFVVKSAKGNKVLKPKMRKTENKTAEIRRRSQIFVERYALPVGKPFSEDKKIFDTENYFREGIINNMASAQRRKDHRPSLWLMDKPAQAEGGFLCPLSELHVL